jgi:glycosyltransferase involved in cell wall biosynthesis
VLLLHNHYQQAGGEDQVFMAEGNLLEERGHRVLRYTLHNDQLSEMSRPGSAKATVWNGAVYRELRALIRKEQPQVAHFHNTFPLISPASYYAARAEGVPVVQTLHNYRLLCPNALFFREGRICEDCLGKRMPWPGVVHGCYRGSRSSSMGVATMLTTHRAFDTWTRAVDAYIALTEFARGKFVEGGLPAQKLVVKPNFVDPDPGVGEGKGGYVLFVGRLSPEKGVETMLGSWERLKKRLSKKIFLKIVGDGPLAPAVAEAAKRHPEIEWLGRQSQARVSKLMKSAQALIFPSVWYEGFPMVIAEAYAAGLPVIASDLGSMQSLIDHGRTGLLFRPNDAEDLADQVQWASAHTAELNRMRSEARAEFEAKYAAERNYQMLTNIYETAIKLQRIRIRSGKSHPATNNPQLLSHKTSV